MKKIGVLSTLVSSLFVLMVGFVAQYDFSVSTRNIVAEAVDTQSPICNMEITPTIIEPGDVALLEWMSMYAIYVNFDNIDIAETEVIGHIEVSPDTTTTYTGVFIGEDSTTETCTATVTVNEPEIPAEEEPETNEPELHDGQAVCPFLPETNRFIVDFTQGGSKLLSDLLIVSNDDKVDSYRHIEARVEPGIYRVSLASHSNPYIYPVPLEEHFKKWHLTLFDVDANEIAVSYSSRNIDEFFVETDDSDLIVPSQSYKAFAYHDAYPSLEENGVVPLCAALDFIAELPVEPEPEPELEPIDSLTTTYLNCPILPQENRTIVDFTFNGQVSLDRLVIRADGTLVDANTGLKSALISKGTYDISYASYSGDIETNNQLYEEWEAVLFNSEGVKLVHADKSLDIPDGEDEYISKAGTQLVLMNDATHVSGQHHAYPNSDAVRFAPLCVAFDLIDVPEEEPPVATKEAQDDVYTEVPSEAPTDTVVTKTEDPVTTAITSSGGGSMNTSVNVPVASDEQISPLFDVVQVSPKDVGLESVMREVTVPAAIVQTRFEVTSTLDDTPFNILASSSKEDRENLAYLLYKSASSTKVGSSTESNLFFITLDRTEEGVPAEEIAIAPEVRLEYAKTITERKGLESMRDTDGDGISDYDEEKIYHTDPVNPFTSGSIFTDGEQVLLGFDPTTDEAIPVVVESPASSGEVVQNIFAIENIELIQKVETPEKENQIKVTGKAQPLAFVTLFMYSSPVIVTVRADSAGKFEYIFDEKLEDGSHEIYVASVNSSGKILAKSESIPFTKTALAIAYAPENTASVDPVQSSMRVMVTFGLLLILIVSIASIAWIGMRRVQKVEQIKAVETYEET